MALSTTQQEGLALPPRQNRLLEFWNVFAQNRLAVLGLYLFVLFFIIAFIGWLLTYGDSPWLDPAKVRLQEKLLPPLSEPRSLSLSAESAPPLGVFVLGTDNLGRDVLARMLQGAWVSLTVGFVAVGISVFVGIIMGGIAGYFGQNRFSLDAMLKTLGLVLAGGLWWLHLPAPALVAAGFTGAYWLAAVKLPRIPGALQSKGVSVDTLIMRFVDIMLCFPSFFLILTVIALLPASIYNIMIVIGLTSWMGTARFVRAEFLSLREQDFVTATKALGLGHTRIIFQHMLPNAVAPVMVSATIGIATAILTEAGLSFLGFGVPPPQATWGNILSEGKNYLFDAPWLTLIPGLAILIVVLAFNLFGEGLRDALNPRLRK